MWRLRGQDRNLDDSDAHDGMRSHLALTPLPTSLQHLWPLPLQTCAHIPWIHRNGTIPPIQDVEYFDTQATTGSLLQVSVGGDDIPLRDAPLGGKALISPILNISTLHLYPGPQ